MAIWFKTDPLLALYCDQLQAQVRQAAAVLKLSDKDETELKLQAIAVRICQLSREIGFRIREIGPSRVKVTDSKRVFRLFDQSIEIGEHIKKDSHGYWSIGNVQLRRKELAVDLQPYAVSV